MSEDAKDKRAIYIGSVYSMEIGGLGMAAFIHERERERHEWAFVFLSSASRSKESESRESHMFLLLLLLLLFPLFTYAIVHSFH